MPLRIKVSDTNRQMVKLIHKASGDEFFIRAQSWSPKEVQLILEGGLDEFRIHRIRVDSEECPHGMRVANNMDSVRKPKGLPRE